MKEFLRECPTEIRPEVQSRIARLERTASAFLSSELSAGETLVGRYLLDREIGRGGLGSVWAALDQRLGRNVAVKVLRGNAKITDPTQATLLEESRALAALNHPNITQLYDVVQAGHSIAAIMELVGEGETLASQISAPGRGRLRADEMRQAVLYFLEPLEGLALAHKKNIVHGDIKPANLLWDGVQLKLTDFSLSVGKELAVAESTAMGLGTCFYAPVEQIHGEALTPATDVFAVGATLYETLVGVPLFPGDSRAEVRDNIAHNKRVFFWGDGARVPRDLRAILIKATAMDASERYSCAGKLISDLRAWLAGHSTVARPPSLPEKAWRWTKANSWQAGAICILLVSIALVSVAMSNTKKKAVQVSTLWDSAQTLLRLRHSLIPPKSDDSVSVQLDRLAVMLDQADDIPVNERIEALEVLAGGMMSLDRFQDAADVLKEAIDLGADVSAKIQYGWCLRYIDPSDALKVLEPIANDELVSTQSERIAQLFAKNRIGTIYLNRGGLDLAIRARKIFREVRVALQGLQEEPTWLTALNLLNLGTAQSMVVRLQSEETGRELNIRDYSVALDTLAESEKVFRSVTAGEHPEVFYIYVARHYIFENLEGYEDEAIAAGKGALKVRRRLGLGHQASTIYFAIGQIKILDLAGRQSEAKRLAEEVLESLLKVDGELLGQSNHVALSMAKKLGLGDTEKYRQVEELFGHLGQ
ncbi:MAG: serine/threonine-protein kinase [Planctomycetota bacterium]|nr:serine/threonine-protein kinase [Planctomycetota bacterium]